MPGFLKSRSSRILTLVLFAQAILFYTLSRGEAVPLAPPLSGFPSEVGGWTLATEGVIEKEVLDVLRADDILNRVYADPGTGQSAGLFVAYFKTQRTGQAPHSPKNCLPGSGWVPSKSETLTIPVTGRAEPISVNRYVVSRGSNKSVVIYWYQSRGQVIASEYRAKFRLVLDSIRYNRSDTALVRIVVPIANGNEAAATETATRFIESVFDPLTRQLPQ